MPYYRYLGRTFWVEETSAPDHGYVEEVPVHRPPPPQTLRPSPLETTIMNQRLARIDSLLQKAQALTTATPPAKPLPQPTRAGKNFGPAGEQPELLSIIRTKAM